MRRLDRNIAIIGGVVLLHVAALWALNTGLLRRTVEIVVPVEMLSEILSGTGSTKVVAMKARS